MLRFGLLCAAAVFSFSAPAWAAKTFVLDGVTLEGGGTLTGSFTTNDALTALEGVNITASAGSFGGFAYAEFTYDNLAQANWVFLPSQGFQISVPGSTPNNPTQELRLNLLPLTATGADIDRSSYEYQIIAGRRTIESGSVVLAAAVPEPATWGLMILGFGLVGAAVRRRNVRTSVRFA